MRNTGALSAAVAAFVAVTLAAGPTGADEREDAGEEKLRKARPTSKAEVARQAANEQLAARIGKADSIELLRLDGVHSEVPARGDLFHGYGVILRTPVAADRRAELVGTLAEKFHWFDGWRTRCFSPRHGLRAVAGADTFDLVICFECHQMVVFGEGKTSTTVTLVGRTWEPAEKLLRAAEKAKAP